MQLLNLPIAAQLEIVSSVLGIVAVVALSFAAITLVASYYRFQSVIQLAETTNPDEMGADAGDILKIQLARYLAGCARRGTSFSLSLIQIRNPEFKASLDAPEMESIKQATRRDDITCIFDDQTVALLTEMEPEDSVAVIKRIIGEIFGACPEILPEQVRVGISSNPGHGLSSRELVEVAQEALENTTFEEPVVLPEIVDVDAEEDDEPEEDAAGELSDGEPIEDSVSSETASKNWKEKRKNSMLDELTGVLKPSAISAYMQRVMGDLRRKKQTAALFCIGVNNVDYIARFHGEQAADDVLVGVSKILQEHFRADDLIGRHEKSAFLALAQCSLDEAEVIGKRISSLVQHAQFESGRKKLKTTITLGVATYPEHGRNLHYLYTAGQKVLDHSRQNDIRAYAVYDPEVHDKVPSKPLKSIKSVQA